MPLYIVATPIGNMDDFSFRGVQILKEIDHILCENPNHSLRLLSHYDIRKPLSPFHDFNKDGVTPGLIKKLLTGMKIALITDAGTPGISDPAFYLVRAAIQAGVPVTSIPGPSAFVSALVASGLATDRFCFEGFLPSKKGRKKRLEKLKEEERTIIFYDAPHRIERTLREIANSLGDRRVVIGRELTKIHEEFIRGKISEISGNFNYKGEMVIIVEGFKA